MINIKQYVKATLLSVTILVISGCASKYVAPEKEPTAAVTFTIEVTKFHPSSATVTAKAFEHGCKKSKDGDVLASFWVASNQTAQEVTIRAGKIFIYTIDFEAQPTKYLAGSRCSISTAFLPEAGVRYQAHFSALENNCRSRLMERFSKDGTSIEMRPVKELPVDRTCY